MTGIRFGGTSNGDYQDHNQLANIGRYSHSEIDEHIDEVDNARGNELSVGLRLDKIENHNTTQDTSLSKIETAITTLEGSVSVINNNVNKNSSDIGDIIKELDDAKVDRLGKKYPTLKERLDAMSVSGGSGGTGGVASGVVRYFMEHTTITSDAHTDIVLTKGSYVVGSNELDVFLNGMRLAKDSDYLELSPTTLKVLTSVAKDDILTVRVRDRSNPLWTNTIITEFIELHSNIQSYVINSTFNTTSMFLEVYLNGALLIETVDYVTTGFNQIDLLFTPSSGDTIICQIVDTNDRGVKQLIEHQTVVQGKTQYTLQSFSVDVGDPNLEVYQNGVLLRFGVDYAVATTTDIVFTNTLYVDDLITFCIENKQGKAVMMSDFEKLRSKVDGLNLLEHKNKVFTLSEWSKVNDTDYTLTFPYTQHNTNRLQIVAVVYELVGEMYYKVGCDITINLRGDIILHAVTPFAGNVVVL